MTSLNQSNYTHQVVYHHKTVLHQVKVHNYDFIYIIYYLVSPVELFQLYSADITDSITSDIDRIVNRLNAHKVIMQSFFEDIISVDCISNYRKAMKVVNHIQTTIKTSPDPHQHLMKVRDVLYQHETLQGIVTVYLYIY